MPDAPTQFFSVAVDLVVLTIRDGQVNVLLVERGNHPFRHRYALPGGFVRPDEDFGAAAARELQEETSIDGVPLEQIGAYGAPDRDPRGRVASVTYLAVAPNLPAPQAGTDAAAAKWVPLTETGHLAFDHDMILGEALERARRNLESTPVALGFCPEQFTADDLKAVYETFWDVPLDVREFEREIVGVEGFVVPVDRKPKWLGGRAAVYRRGEATKLHPPLRRPLG
ncbi:NUDIX domain-containing protein [Lentzea sp. NPDC058436]|uniref:NUDIX hydrolase n=1 Tax=Lentzea sp. NPDC058436 TaxID=3346499 RepID=UPI0036505D21